MPSKQQKKQPKQPTTTVSDFKSRYPGGEEVPQPTGDWFAFENVGDELVGEFRGVQPFRNGNKGTMLTANGQVVFSCATLLKQQLESITIGERIAIVLAGFQASDKESPIKVFQVFRLPQSRR